MENPSTLFWGILFGTIGIGLFTYGKKQKAIVPLCVGVALFIMPYCITNIIFLIITGVILLIVPYFFRF